MIKKQRSRSWLHLLTAVCAITGLAGPALSAKASSTIIGPPNPGFEDGGLDWNTGGPGGAAGSSSFANSPTNGPSAPGTNCVLMTSDGSVSPPNGNDLRVNYFSLGAAALGNSAVTVEFDYNILNAFTAGHAVRVDLRWEDANGGFLGEQLFYVGTPNGDVGAQGWKHFVGTATPIATAVNCDIRISMNIFGDDIWSDGPVLFDNFSVAVNNSIGPVNPGFENGGTAWNSGGAGGAAGSVNFANPGTNGPSAPGTNCVLQTSNGGGNADLRANMFSLGAATQGATAVSVDFDYNILGPVNFGDQIRVGFRSLDSGGGFQGEHNFHLGTPNNDVGGTGWHHFHGVATPSSTAVNGDLRISMNIFGDDTWSSGDVLFDNFSVKITPVIGPNNNADFENGEVNWNAGGPGGSGGSQTFLDASNGWSAPGTNCVLMTADGTVTPSGGNDIRVNSFLLPNNSQPVTISFDYNILNPVNSGNQIRVGLRFFDSGNNFNGEHNTYIGTPNGDTGGQGWKHLSETYSVPAGSVTADIRVSMNIFGDDIWSSGPVLFDNFTVVTGTNSSPVAGNLTMGTLINLPVTRPAAAGATDSGGLPLSFTYLGQPTNGTVVTDGANITYTPNTGYTGSDQFAYGVSDGLGGFATGQALVTVNPGPGLNKFTSSANSGVNSAVLSFSGAANCDYVLESASGLTPPVVWTPVSTNAANGSGSVTFTNQATGTGGFWRTLLLP